jgi:hypothetical protein
MSRIERSKDGKEVGFFIKDGSLTLIVPKFYDVQIPDRKSINREILLFYKLFKKYKRDVAKQKSIIESDEHFAEKKDIIDDEYAFSVIEMYFNLINDYFDNNLLLFRERETNLVPAGNINWKKTMKSNSEIIHRNTVFYKDIYYNNLVFDYRHPVTILYCCALNEVSEVLGYNFKLPYDKSFLTSFTNDNSNIRYILKRYRREMFSDREKRIFRILDSLYSERNAIDYARKSNKELSYIQNFNSIWEIMLKVSLFDEYHNYKDMLPRGEYQVGDYSFGGLTPIPDIILNIDSYILVLDAKNYVPDYEKSQGLPSTADIIKQIFYGYFLSDEFNPINGIKKENFINAFLLPVMSESKNAIMYSGKHHISIPADKPQHDIHLFSIDFNTLREYYLNPSKDYRTRITNYIVEAVLHK